MRPLALGMLLLLAASSSACDEPGASKPTPSATAPGSAKGSAATSASAPAKKTHPQQGTYRGDFEAKKGKVPLDDGVSYPTWEEDEGTAAVGKGTVELTVDDAGAVTGTLEGALGKLSVRGAVEEAKLAAVLEPADPNAEGAMTGTLTGTFSPKGAMPKGMKGELRASSRDGNLARTAALKLERAPKKPAQ